MLRQNNLSYNTMDYQALVNSYIYMNSLVTWPNGKSRSMDIDSVSFNGEYIFIRSGKTFWMDKIKISMTEFTLKTLLKELIPTCDIWFIGTDSNTLLDDEDEVWFIPIESAANIKQDNSSGSIPWVIPRYAMESRTRREFNFYANKMLDVKGNPCSDPKEVALRNFEKSRNGR